ncbi:MAG: ImmA/IrrE family metallo-endopeptidase [Armatimonadota bacterium]
MQRPLAGNAEQLDTLLCKFLSRFSRIGTSNIESVAAKFCEAYGLHEFPRDPRHHLPLFGIEIESSNLGEVRAVWIRWQGRYIIQCSKFLPGQLGLVLWHEFFEILSAQVRFPGRLPSQIEERLATRFAVYLMMPEVDILKHCSELRHPEVNKTGVLADRFGVSFTAMKMRLRELRLEHKSELARCRYL